ncbi:hypothetical protein [uncultured Mesotoga sp.]|uniref:hypothetical protein n=1 Tax=uncultured Mesotoga sp. TaxID=1184400 RepID=UPI0025957032|nr:hypothetical protein [uncultured Mesotoga sp.]
MRSLGKIVTAILVLVLFASVIVSTESEETEPGNLVKSIGREVVDSATEISTLKAEEVLVLIRENLKALDDISSRVEKLKESDQSDADLNAVVKDLKMMADNYRKIADMKDEIRAELLKRLNSIDASIEEAQEKKRDELVEINSLKESLNNISFELKDPEKREIRQKSLESQIKSAEQRLSMWESFINRLDSIRQASESITEEIDKLVFILAENADVYYAAYLTFELARDIYESIAYFKELIDLNTLSESLMSSWDKLSDMIDQLDQFIASL